MTKNTLFPSSESEVSSEEFRASLWSDSLQGGGGHLLTAPYLSSKTTVSSPVRRQAYCYVTVTLETQQERLPLVAFSLAPRFESHLHLNVLFNLVKNASLFQTFGVHTGFKRSGNLSKAQITLSLTGRCTAFLSGLSAESLCE